MALYKCKNCGFVFRTPLVRYYQTPLNPGRAWAIAREALYYPVPVCPKCGSDAIEEVEE